MSPLAVSTATWSIADARALTPGPCRAPLQGQSLRAKQLCVVNEFKILNSSIYNLYFDTDS